jgi:hypothetical protein
MVLYLHYLMVPPLLSLLLQVDMIKKVGVPAGAVVNSATDAVLNQENMTIKLLWGVVVVMTFVFLLVIAGSVLAYRGFLFLKKKESEQDQREADQKEKDTHQVIDLTKIDVLSERVEGLVSLLAQAQAIDQGHSSSHIKFVQDQLSGAQTMVQELYSEMRSLQQNSREQDKESMKMVEALKAALDLFSGRVLSMQESLVTSISMRENNHTEVCGLVNSSHLKELNLLNTLISILLQHPFAGGVPGAAHINSPYNLQQNPDAKP